jgi:transcriptional regulator with XRE-family HTH domain
MPFCDRLQTLRERAGLTQQELAVKAGMAQSSVAKLERNETRDPKWSSICALALALGVSLDEFKDPDGACAT